MIDYEKLKQAHELLEKYAQMHKQRCDFRIDAVVGSINDSYRIGVSLNPLALQADAYDNIDDLIAKLTELTQPEPKYRVGDMVWTVSYPIIAHHFIEKIEDGKYFMQPYQPSRAEESIYPTKQALIEAQIAYWESQHELKHDDPIKCKKCGARSRVGKTVALGGNFKCEHDWILREQECEHE